MTQQFQASPRPTQQANSLYLPRPSVDLGQVDLLIFAPHGGPLQRLAPDVLGLAALYRAVLLQRGLEPALVVESPESLTSWAVEKRQNKELDQARPGATALLLSSAPFSRDGMRQILGAFELAGHILAERPPTPAKGSVHDSVASTGPLAAIAAERLIRNCGDSIVQELLALSRGVHEPLDSFDLRQSLELALRALEIRGRRFISSDSATVEGAFEQLKVLVEELATGSKSPAVCAERAQEYCDAEATAISIWEGAEEVSQGVFRLPLLPIREQDPLVRHCLMLQYTADQSAYYVLEHRHESEQQPLTLEEANNFHARLGAGEEADKLLCEVTALLLSRGEDSRVSWIQRAEMRGEQSTDVLSGLLDSARQPEGPQGRIWVVKWPQHVSVVGLLEKNDVDVCAVRPRWSIDPESGNSQPPGVSFPAGQLFDALHCLR